ncbi:MAG: aminotransferase class V-fold PLP-dependent enzyme [Elusimicrobiota bacterium]
MSPAEFPVTREKAYLAHAAVAPLPSRVVRAISAYAEEASLKGQFSVLTEGRVSGARGLAAELLGASPEEVAFTSCTSMGLSLVAQGLDWKPGQSVVIAEGDFPANTYPWLALERRGVRVNSIPARPDGSLSVEDVEARLDAGTRLVSLSSAHYVTGAVLDIDSVGRRLRERGVLFCLDAIQTLGALPCPLRHVDFLAADAHKWLLGPEGIAVLYVRRALQDSLFPAVLGWRSVRDLDDYAKVRLEFPDSARRYEPGSPNILGIFGLEASLSLLLEQGPGNVAKRLRELRRFLVEGLERKGCELAWRGENGCITSFRRGDEDMKALHKRLERKGVVVSLREFPSGKPWIRVSPHFYNTEEEIECLLEAL